MRARVWGRPQARRREAPSTCEWGQQNTYDQTGDKISQEDANRHATSFVYDYATVVLTQRFLPDGSEESFTDDAAGQILTRQDYKGQITRYTYDPMGRVLTRSYADGTGVTFTYTPTGQRATAVDSRGTTTYAYDSRNRLTLLTYPDGRQLAYAYDAHGNRTALTAKIGSSSLTTSTAYDAENRPTTVTDPLGRSYAASYDADDAPAQMQYPNGTETTYGYDARHRLTDIQATNIATRTPITSFGYTLDTEGERTQVLEADGTVRQYGYDSISRLTSETVTGSLAYAKQFTYDAVGNRQTQITTGSGAASVTYAYDSRDRLTTENSTAYGYDADGNVTSKAGEASYQWDFENRLSDVTLSSGALVSHQYDADGNRVQTRVAAAPGGAVACASPSGTFLREDTTTQGNWPGVYGADGEAINAVTPALPSYAGLTFTNASSFTWSANTTSPHALEDPPPSTSRIASTWYSSTSMTMHVAVGDGNAHTVAFYLLDWNGENITETISAQTPGGVVLDAARPYGGFTQGVWAVYQVCGDVDFVFTRTGTGGNAVVSGVFLGAPVGAASVDNLLVDTAECPSCGGGGLSQNVAETDSSGNLTALYVRNRDRLLAVMRPGSTPGTWTTRFIHGDGLGSVRALTDETGTATDTRGYEAFGTKNVEAGSDPLAYGFAGEPFQSDSMLAYHRARWMDARVGRFEGMDQVDGDDQNPLSLHRYVYGADSPANRIDPSGNDDIGDVGLDSEPNYAVASGFAASGGSAAGALKVTTQLATATAAGITAAIIKAAAIVVTKENFSLNEFGCKVSTSAATAFGVSIIAQEAGVRNIAFATALGLIGLQVCAPNSQLDIEAIAGFFPTLGSLAGTALALPNGAPPAYAAAAGTIFGHTLQLATLNVYFTYYERPPITTVPNALQLQQQVQEDLLPSP